MLNTVLRIDAARIATTFALPRTTVAQRLVRARRHIRDTGIPFALPMLADLPDRRGDVLEDISGPMSSSGRCLANFWRDRAPTTLG